LARASGWGLQIPAIAEQSAQIRSREGVNHCFQNKKDAGSTNEICETAKKFHQKTENGKIGASTFDGSRFHGGRIAGSVWQ
jgi:hypothetical protein